MSKKVSVALLALFILFLALPPVTTLLTPDRAFSELENRPLVHSVDLDWQAVRSAAYVQRVESYFADQFVFRDELVSLMVSMDFALGKREQSGVYIGRGRLFEKLEQPKEEKTQKNIAALNSFAKSMTAIGAATYVLPAYSSQVFYSQLLPARAPVVDERALMARLEASLTGLTLVDSYKTLEEHSQENIYFATDHHWTQYGAYLAGVELTKAMGLALPLYTDAQEGVPFYGSLYSRAPLYGLTADNFAYCAAPAGLTVDYPDTGEQFFTPYRYEFLERKDKYSFFMGTNYSRVVISGQGGTGRSLLVLKDSFAHALLPMLAGQFDAIHVLDLRYFRGSVKDYAQGKAITHALVVYNLPRLVDDGYLFAAAY